MVIAVTGTLVCATPLQWHICKVEGKERVQCGHRWHSEFSSKHYQVYYLNLQMLRIDE